MQYGDYLNEARSIAKEIRWNCEKFDEESYDQIHQYADGRREVIYYSHAWDFVNYVRKWDWDRYERASEAALDLNGKPLSVDTLMCQIAYHIWIEFIEEAVQEAEEVTA